MPRIESIQGLGKLEHDPEFEWSRSQPVKVNVLNERLLPFILEDGWNQISLLRPIESSVANFLSLGPEHREQLTELVYKNYEEVRKIATVAALPMQEKSDIWKYVYPTDIFIKQSFDDPEIYIIVCGNCKWEPEHGLQMVFKKGNEVSVNDNSFFELVSLGALLQFAPETSSLFFHSHGRYAPVERLQLQCTYKEGPR